ncbi:hypothetical protein IU498_09590 [Nocardia beijingensis]|uniref:hypothetical protein n=1 Tax=Nocardia beijingensis TaxID=95162 RepID=UPI001895320D|nr:hypothetical protein [Nocardia beijingensis]MBF6074879.1 hypothetical protein [Nocardia beijingensis]
MTTGDEADPTGWFARLQAAAQDGQPLDFSLDPRCQGKDPAQIGGRSASGPIPAQVIRRVLVAVGHAAAPQGLEIRGARIAGDLDLSYVDFNRPLKLVGCTIDEHVELSYAKLRQLSFVGSELPSLDMSHIVVEGSLHIDRLSVSCGVTAYSARIGGRLTLTSANLSNPSGPAFTFDAARITGDVIADNLTSTSEVRALGAEINGQLSMQSACLSSLSGHAVSLDNACITGGIFADNLKATGAVRLPGAQIDSQLSFVAAEVSGPQDEAFDLSSVRITGRIWANDLKVTGAVLADGARVDGRVILESAQLSNPTGNALGFDNARITGGIFADNLKAIGTVRALAAQIDGELSLASAQLSNPTGNALGLDNARITGGIFADNLKAIGTVRAVGAQINSQLSVKSAELTNPTGNALDLDNARITGGIFADNLKAIGAVRAVRAEFGPQLSLRSAQISNPKNYAVCLDSARITGSLLATGLRAVGEVRLPGAQIDDQLDLRRITISEANGVALRLESTRIKVLILSAVKDVDGKLDLTRAQIDDLRTDPDGPPPANLIATGWQIRDIHGRIRADRKMAASWLDSTTNVADSTAQDFTAQPWHELADVYDRNGDPAGARYLRFHAAKRTTRKARTLDKIIPTIYGWFVGYGYQPWRTAVWLVVVFVAGTLLISGNRQYFVPIDIAAARTTAALHAQESQSQSPISITAATPCNLLPDYPCLKPATFALSNVVPVAAAIPRPDWTIRSDAPEYISLLLAFFRILSWILVALLLAGITGLLRKA